MYISRRPTIAAPSRKSIGHAAALGYDVSDHPANHGVEEEEEASNISRDDLNWSMFDLNVDSIDVTLSLWRWLDGKGLVEDAVVRGVRGVLGKIISGNHFVCVDDFPRSQISYVGPG